MKTLAVTFVLFVLAWGTINAGSEGAQSATSSHWYELGQLRHAEDNFSAAMDHFRHALQLFSQEADSNQSNTWMAATWLLQCRLQLGPADEETVNLTRQLLVMATNLTQLPPEHVVDAYAKAGLAALDNRQVLEAFRYITRACKLAESSTVSEPVLVRQLKQVASDLIFQMPAEDRIPETEGLSDPLWHALAVTLSAMPTFAEDDSRADLKLKRWLESHPKEGIAWDKFIALQVGDDSPVQYRRFFPAFNLKPVPKPDVALALSRKAKRLTQAGDFGMAILTWSKAHQMAKQTLGATNAQTLDMLRGWAQASYARVESTELNRKVGTAVASDASPRPEAKRERARLALPIQLEWARACTNRYGPLPHEEHVAVLGSIASLYHILGDKELAFAFNAQAYLALETLRPSDTQTRKVGLTAEMLLSEVPADRRVPLAVQTGDRRLAALGQLLKEIDLKAVVGGISPESFERGQIAENDARAKHRSFRRLHPDWAALVDQLPFRRRSPIDPVRWLELQWNRWNSIFEANTPQRDALTLKRNVGPFEVLPASVESNALIMALATQDLKGWITERETQLFSARQRSTNPAIASLRLSAAEMRNRLNRLSRTQFSETSLSTNALALYHGWLAAEGALRHQLLGLPELQRPLNPTVEDVRRALPEKTVLLEYLSFGREPATEEDDVTNYYGVAIIGQGVTDWRGLGPVAGIDQLILQVQSSMRLTETNAPDDATLQGTLSQLHDLLWRPISTALPTNTQRIVVCPDNSLWLLPFGILWRTNHFLGEDFQFSYVQSGRDLHSSNRTQGAASGGSIVAVGNPDFDTLPRGYASGFKRLLGLAKAFGREGFGSLPSSAQEIVDLQRLARSNDLPSPITYTGNSADESAVRRIDRPWLLHLSTHGFFAPEVPEGETNDLRIDPLAVSPVFEPEPELARCGLALAGANRTLEAWWRNQSVAGTNDNLLLASEIADLKLDGTWLVSLSACDTGLGYLAEGEGCFGVRRAFLRAGVRNIVTTLWPVYDVHTPLVFDEFYRYAFASRDLPDALQRVQRSGFARLRKAPAPHALWRAVKNYGPYVLTVTHARP